MLLLNVESDNVPSVWNSSVGVSNSRRHTLPQHRPAGGPGPTRNWVGLKRGGRRRGLGRKLREEMEEE